MSGSPSDLATPGVRDDLRSLIPIVRDGPFTVVGLRGRSAFMAGMTTAVFGGTAIAFLVPLVSASVSPGTWRLVLVGLVLVLGCAVAAVVVRRHHAIAAGHDSLIIDHESEVLDLPRRYGTRRQTLVPFARVTSVTVQLDASIGSAAGDRGAPTGVGAAATHAVRLAWQDGTRSERSATIAVFTERAPAELLARWLGRTISPREGS